MNCVHLVESSLAEKQGITKFACISFHFVTEVRDSLALPKSLPLPPQHSSLRQELFIYFLTLQNCQEPDGLSWGEGLGNTEE